MPRPRRAGSNDRRRFGPGRSAGPGHPPSPERARGPPGAGTRSGEPRRRAGEARSRQGRDSTSATALHGWGPRPRGLRLGPRGRCFVPRRGGRRSGERIGPRSCGETRARAPEAGRRARGSRGDHVASRPGGREESPQTQAGPRPLAASASHSGASGSPTARRAVARSFARTHATRASSGRPLRCRASARASSFPG